MISDIRLSEIIAPSFHELHREMKRGVHDEVWLKGGRGSTKSTFASIQILLGMFRDKEANAVVARRYQNELRDTVFGQFQWSASKLGMGDELKFQISPMQIVRQKTGQKIIFRAADNPMKLKSINLGRGYIKYAWFEEVDQFSGMEEIRNILQSLFRGEEHRRIAIFSFNPPRSARSWVNQEVKIERDGRSVHHSDYRDIPREWLGERFLADAEHLQKVNETAWRHEYLGEEVGTGLEVFNNVNLRRITDEEIAGFDQIRQGLDFGYAVDPLAFERLNLLRQKRRVLMFHEIHGIGLFNREFFEKAKQFKDELTIADSAEPKSIAELNQFGMRIAGAKKGPGSVEHGIKFFQDMEEIVIDPARCPLAAKEFVNYSLETDRNGEVKSRFPDKDNHSIDAARYAVERDLAYRPQIGAVIRR